MLPAAILVRCVRAFLLAKLTNFNLTPCIHYTTSAIEYITLKSVTKLEQLLVARFSKIFLNYFKKYIEKKKSGKNTHFFVTENEKNYFKILKDKKSKNRQRSVLDHPIISRMAFVSMFWDENCTRRVSSRLGRQSPLIRGGGSVNIGLTKKNSRANSVLNSVLYNSSSMHNCLNMNRKWTSLSTRTVPLIHVNYTNAAKTIQNSFSIEIFVLITMHTTCKLS